MAHTSRRRISLSTMTRQRHVIDLCRYWDYAGRPQKAVAEAVVSSCFRPEMVGIISDFELRLLPSGHSAPG